MPAMAHACGADFSLLYDGDAESGKAYIAYGAWHNYNITMGWKSEWYPEWARKGHQIALQKLDIETFMAPDPHGPPAVTVSPVLHQESPAYFKRGDYHYLRKYEHTVSYHLYIVTNLGTYDY